MPDKLKLESVFENPTGEVICVLIGCSPPENVSKGKLNPNCGVLEKGIEPPRATSGIVKPIGIDPGSPAEVVNWPGIAPPNESIELSPGIIVGEGNPALDMLLNGRPDAKSSGGKAAPNGGKLGRGGNAAKGGSSGSGDVPSPGIPTSDGPC